MNDWIDPNKDMGKKDWDIEKKVEGLREKLEVPDDDWFMIQKRWVNIIFHRVQ